MRYLILLFIFTFLACNNPSGEVSTTDIKQENISPPYIKILGTAQDAGYPQIGCTKPCCEKIVEGKTTPRNVSCIALVTDSGYYLFDATPDITENIGSQNNKLPNGIFLTHGHIGHYTGLMYLGREAMGAKQIPVYCMPRMQNYLVSSGPWSQLVELDNIAIQPIDEESKVSLENGFIVEPFLVPHRDEFTETVGYRISKNGTSVVFIPDIDKWGKWHQDLKRVIENNTYVLIDGTFYNGKELPGRDMTEIPHPFVVETMELLKDLPAEEKAKVHFIHFNHTNPLLDKNSLEYKEVIKQGFNIAEQNSTLPWQNP